MPTNHSYEEIRAVLCDILAGREKVHYPPTQYSHLEIDVAEVFHRREPATATHSFIAQNTNLSPQDADLFMEVFWDLFRQGIITLGSDRANRDFPHCRLSRFGKAVIENQQVYFFHDVTSYETLIRSQVPKIDDTTLLYVKEAMQAFRSGCILSASVMLGVAAEHEFLLLLETIEQNPKHQAAFAAVQKERNILPKINKFRTALDKQAASLPPDLKEDLDSQLTGIQSLIRTFRNDSGHPTGKIIDREQAYVLLNLFIPYAKKVQQLKAYFATP